MNRRQKIAWFNLIVITIGLVLVVVLASAKGYPKLCLAIFIGTGILPVISGLLFQKKRSKVDFDERDAQIRLNACFMALAISVGGAVALLIMHAFKVGPRGSVPVNTIVGILGGYYFTFILTKSILTLIQYGWRSHNGEK